MPTRCSSRRPSPPSSVCGASVSVRCSLVPASAADTSAAVALLIEWSPGVSPALVTSTAGACSHRPRQGLSSQIAEPLEGRSPDGPIVRSSSATSSPLPLHMQAMSVQTCATTGARGSSANSA